MRARRGWAWLLSFALAAAAPGARRLCAQVPENADFALAYQAPDGCPDRSHFERQLRARMPQRAAASARIEVRITRDASKSVGELALARPGEQAAVRRIEAARCEEVAEALALATALLLDPPARAPAEQVRAPNRTPPAGAHAPRQPRRGARPESPPEGAPQPAVVPQAAPLPGVAAEGAPTQTPADGEPAGTAPAQAPAEREPARAAPAAPAAERVRRQLTLSAAALVATGVAPAARVGGAFALGLLSRRARLELAGSVGVRVVQRTSSERDEGRLEMSWWSGSAAACAGSALGARGALAGCLAGELGRLAAAGSDTSMPDSSERLWAALGPALRGRWQVFGPFSVEAGALALFPLFRHRYLLGDETVFSVPRLTFRAELGVSWQFP